jgi:phosphotriesterase-related protein
VLGHSGDTTDADHLSELAEAGFILGMDRFGLNAATTFENRADIVVELCRRGFAGQLVLSHDTACYIDWIDPDVRPLLTQWHYLHIEQEVLPYLRERGVGEDQVTAMLVDTPRRYFEAG